MTRLTYNTDFSFVSRLSVLLVVVVGVVVVGVGDALTP